MASSKMRGAFIKNVQKSVLENRKHWYDRTEDFIGVLQEEINNMSNAVWNNINKMLRDERSNYDEGWKFRTERQRILWDNLKHFEGEIFKLISSSTMQHLIDTYTDTLNCNNKHIGEPLGVDLVQLPIGDIIEAINYPWSGTMWSDRVWSNTRDLTNDIKGIISRGFLVGDSNEKMAKRIKKEYLQANQKYKYCTERIIRTETARVSYVSDVRTWKKLGVKKVQFEAILDSKTSRFCREHDQQEYDLEFAPQLPAHPFCRSCYVPVVINPTDRIMAEREEEKNKKNSKKNDKKIEEKLLEKARGIANKFKGKENDRVLKYLDREEQRIKEEYALYKNINVGFADKRAEKKYNDFMKNVKTVKDNISKGDYYEIIDSKVGKIEMSRGTIMYNNCKLSHYQKFKDGKFYLALDTVKNKAERDKIIAMCDNAISNNKLLYGVGVRVNGTLVNKVGSSTGAYFSPNLDTLTMRDFVNTRKFLDRHRDNEGEEDYFKSVLYHELGHRNHNFNYSDNMDGLVLTKKQWEKWKEQIEPYYEKYKNERIDWRRFVYPTQAEKYYSDRLKEHYYKEMWAESNSVLGNTMADNYEEELEKLNNYFPNIKGTIENLLNSSIKDVIN
ncbi:MAG: minor capsid protein [Cetobacterium sp.]